MQNLQAVLAGVGPRLRAVRRRRGLTLAQLSSEVGISVSTLSRLESGIRRPTLELLLPLARAHRVALDELVGAPVTGDPRVHPRPVRRGGVTWVRLAGNATGMRAYKQVLPVGSPAAEPRDLCRHEGYEWVYVLDGELGLTLGDRTHVLTTGEAAEFDTQVPHAYVNLGNAPLELLLIVGEQGARIHLRVRDDASVPNTIPDE